MVTGGVDLVALAFGAFNILRLASYFPQIVAVARDRHGATAISFSCWLLWVGANGSTALYAWLNLNDLSLALINAFNAACCMAVVALAAYKRLAGSPHVGESRADALPAVSGPLCARCDGKVTLAAAGHQRSTHRIATRVAAGSAMLVALTAARADAIPILTADFERRPVLSEVRGAVLIGLDRSNINRDGFDRFFDAPGRLNRFLLLGGGRDVRGYGPALGLSGVSFDLDALADLPDGTEALRISFDYAFAYNDRRARPVDRFDVRLGDASCFSDGEPGQGRVECLLPVQAENTLTFALDEMRTPGNSALGIDNLRVEPVLSAVEPPQIPEPSGMLLLAAGLAGLLAYSVRGGKRCLAAKVAVAIGAAFPTFANAGGMPAELMEAVRAIGPVIDMPNTAKIYASLHAKEPYAGISVQRDIAYGAASRNLLDVFSTNSGDAAKPVLVFVHGGGHVRGDRRVSADSPFYDNIPLWAAKNGMVGISITYRLAPQYPWPAGAEDVGAAIAWVRANVARYGGNPSRIVLMGHSAGATHVASYIAMPKLHDAGTVGIAGAVLVSGTFLLKPELDVPEGQKAYFGADSALWTARSALSGLAASAVPMLVAHGELDVPYYITQAQTLKAA